MRVVLNENVKGLGKKLDEVNVSEGYARNFLLPKHLASLADAKAVSEAASKKDSISFKHNTEKQKAKMIKKQIEGIELEFKIKIGESGKAFGSITQKEIEEEIKTKTGLNIDKKKIELIHPIKTEGNYEVKIKLFEGTTATQKIRVIGG